MNVRFCTKKIYFLLNNPFFTLVERSPRSIEFRPPSIYFWHILIRRRVSLYQSSQSLFHRPIPRNDFKNLKTSSFPTFTFAWWKVNLKIYPLWGRGRAVACAGRTHVMEKRERRGFHALWTNEREEERRVKCGDTRPRVLFHILIMEILIFQRTATSRSPALRLTFSYSKRLSIFIEGMLLSGTDLFFRLKIEIRIFYF